MFFSMVNRNKENILYAILTIFLLERVRTGWNRVETIGRKHGAARPDIELRQDRLVVKAAFLYALPLLLPVVKYIYRSIAELSYSVEGLAVMKNIWVFFGVVVVVECFIALVIYNLLKIYIDRMNAAVGFFAKIGRNIWDGSKVAVQVGSDLGYRVAGGVRGFVTNAWKTTRRATTGLGRRSYRTARALPDFTASVVPARLRIDRRLRTLHRRRFAASGRAASGPK
jgi:hypothetical protein